MFVFQNQTDCISYDCIITRQLARARKYEITDPSLTFLKEGVFRRERSKKHDQVFCGNQYQSLSTICKAWIFSGIKSPIAS